MSARWLDRALLDAVVAEAQRSPRRRMNRNFHPHDDHPAHRLLNAIEPDSYVRPHRHLDPLKDETILCVKGRLGCILFDDSGRRRYRAAIGDCGLVEKHYFGLSYCVPYPDHSSILKSA